MLCFLSENIENGSREWTVVDRLVVAAECLAGGLVVCFSSRVQGHRVGCGCWLCDSLGACGIALDEFCLNNLGRAGAASIAIHSLIQALLCRLALVTGLDGCCRRIDVQASIQPDDHAIAVIDLHNSSRYDFG